VAQKFYLIEKIVNSKDILKERERERDRCG
jgi:hypothetical protein